MSADAELLDAAHHLAEARRHREQARKWWLLAGALLLTAAVIDLVRGDDEKGTQS